jgi:phenylacetate-CoA ligase
MLKLKGTTIYPPAIFDVLDNIDYVANYVVMVGTNNVGTDEVTVKVGLKDGFCNQDNDLIVKEIKDRFRAHIRVAPNVEIADADLIQRINFPQKSRKPVKFIDERKR